MRRRCTYLATIPPGNSLAGAKARGISAVIQKCRVCIMRPPRVFSQTREGRADMELVDIFQAGFTWLADGVVENSTLLLACILIDVFDATWVKERRRHRATMQPVTVARRVR